MLGLNTGVSLAVVLALAGSAANADLIYDTTVGAGGSGTAGLLFTTNNPNASMGDDLTVDDTVPGGGIARRLNFGFVVPANVTVPDCDAIVTFYQTHVPTATGTDPGLTDAIESIRINFGAFAPSASNRGFLSGMVDIPGPGIDLSGGERGVSIHFVAAGTDTILTGATITPAFSTGAVGVGSNQLNLFYLDGFSGNTLDAIYVGAERVGFGGANAANNKLWLQLDNVPAPGAAGLFVLGAFAASRRRR